MSSILPFSTSILQIDKAELIKKQIQVKSVQANGQGFDHKTIPVIYLTAPGKELLLVCILDLLETLK